MKKHLIRKKLSVGIQTVKVLTDVSGAMIKTAATECSGTCVTCVAACEYTVRICIG